MNLLSQQNGPIPMPLLSIGTATDITNDKYTAASNHVVRIAAITQCRIWRYNPTLDYKQGTGLLLPVIQELYPQLIQDIELHDSYEPVVEQL